MKKAQTFFIIFISLYLVYLVFALLKICHFITWSWGWVYLPFSVGIGFIIGMIIGERCSGEIVLKIEEKNKPPAC